MKNQPRPSASKFNDAKRAREVCAGVQSGEIVVFDKAYVDFNHLYDLFVRGVFWVTRTKSSHRFTVLKRRKITNQKILADEEVGKAACDGKYPERMRRARALVEVDGAEREMEFLTDNMEWSASSVADLYRCRWDIEVFFKQIKQTLKLADFPGHSANAVRWQVLSALPPAAAPSGVPFGLGKQLHPAFHPDSLCSLAAVGPACAFEKLWDSRRRLSNYSHPGTRTFPGFQALSYGTATRSLY